MVRVQAGLVFQPEKVNVFSKDCWRGGKEVTCMSVTVCLSLRSRTGSVAMATAEVGEFSTAASGGWAGPVAAAGRGQLLAGGAGCWWAGSTTCGRGQL